MLSKYQLSPRIQHISNYSLCVGCDINARDEIGYTALHLSAEHGYTEMMKVLLKHEAQVNFNIPPEFDDDFPTDALDEPLRLALKVRNGMKLFCFCMVLVGSGQVKLFAHTVYLSVF